MAWPVPKPSISDQGAEKSLFRILELKLEGTIFAIWNAISTFQFPMTLEGCDWDKPLPIIWASTIAINALLVFKICAFR
jgi:hypothetical protein